MKEIEELMEVKPEIIAMDATISKRPGNKSLDEFFHEVKAKYPDQLWMADCSTIEEALHADELGFDFIGTTMVGYTEQSKGDKIEANDFEILRKIIAGVKHKVIAEGNINTPEKARRVIELGAYSVVVRVQLSQDHSCYKGFCRRDGALKNFLYNKRKERKADEKLRKVQRSYPSILCMATDEKGEVSPEGVQAINKILRRKRSKRCLRKRFFRRMHLPECRRP